MTKIKTIAELKQKIAGILSRNDDNKINAEILKVVSEFDASVKDRIEYLKENQHDIDDWCQLELLCRLLRK